MKRRGGVRPGRGRMASCRIDTGSGVHERKSKEKTKTITQEWASIFLIGTTGERGMETTMYFTFLCHMCHNMGRCRPLSPALVTLL